MADMRSIKARMKSVENIGQITKSLKTVSAAKLRSVQSRLAGTAEFSEKCREILREIIDSGEGTKNVFVHPHEEDKTVCIVALFGSRGLCGGYNTALLRYLTSQVAAEGRKCLVVAVGHWGKESLAGAGIEPVRRFEEISDVPSAEEASALSEYLKELFTSGEADAVELVYQKYVSALSQTPTTKHLLPLQALAEEQKRSTYIFEPDRDTLIEKLVQLDIDNEIYSTLLEAKKGEHSARMNTMSAAADNTDELLEELLLEMNHIRQTAITTELAEMMGGNCKSEEQ